MDRKQAPLSRQILGIIDTFARTLREHDIRVTRLVLFGSQARGDAQEWSDIDLAVVSPDFGDDYCGERLRLMKLARGASAIIEPHPLRPEDLNDRWSSLAQEIREHGITVG